MRRFLSTRVSLRATTTTATTAMREVDAGDARAVIRPAPRLRAALFDLDGTMADSDPMHFVVFDELLRRTGVLRAPLTHEYFKENIAGGSNADIFARLYPDKSAEEREAMAEAKEASFREALAREALRPARGLRALLDACDARGVKTVVVTNAPRANAEAMLTQLGLREYFGDERLVIGTECARSKPNPDPYLEGLRRCGVSEEPEACVAFEDSPAGARAAVAANIPTVGILSSQSEETLAGVGCCMCVDDFASPALLAALGM